MGSTTNERRVLIVDGVWAGVFALVCLPATGLQRPDLLVLLVFAAALAVRRRVPACSLGIAWAGAILQMLMLRDPQLSDAAVLGVLYTTAAHGSRVMRWAGLASAGVGSLVATAYLGLVLRASGGGSFPGELVGHVLVLAVLFVASASALGLAWTAGLLARSVRTSRESRRREEAALRERQLAEYRYVVEQERNRIARDMHDVVAHSLAVVIAQADGARFAAKTRPEAAVDALATIAEVSRGALGDVRSLLAELRHDEGERPQPVLDDLPVLLAQVHGAGLEVVFAEHGERVPLGTGHEIALYRIVQEALTNALRHGDTARPVELDLAWDAAGATVEVRNTVRPDPHPATPQAPRHGVPGMRERAQLAGGTLHVEAAGVVFVVRARIPSGAGRPA